MVAREWHVGQQIEPLVIESVDPGRIKTMAAFFRTRPPIILDPAATRARGMGETLATQGALNMTWFTETAARFAGGWVRLLAFNVRFLDNVYAGETVECTGTVTALDIGKGKAELELLAAADGRPVLAGTAVVRAG